MVRVGKAKNRTWLSVPVAVVVKVVVCVAPQIVGMSDCVAIAGSLVLEFLR